MSAVTLTGYSKILAFDANADSMRMSAEHRLPIDPDTPATIATRATSSWALSSPQYGPAASGRRSMDLILVAAVCSQLINMGYHTPPLPQNIP